MQRYHHEFVFLRSAAAAASALLHINIIILGAEAAAAAGVEWWNLVRSVRAPIGHFLRLPIDRRAPGQTSLGPSHSRLSLSSNFLDKH